MTPTGTTGVSMFPAGVACVVIDNLNACFQEHGNVPGNAKSDKYVGLRAGDGQEWFHINRLMDLVRSNFRSAIYICTAPASDWQISPAFRQGEFDLNSSQVRDMARGKGLACWTGKAFWDSLDPYRLERNAYHFGEPGNFLNLAYLWD
eukprot:1148729-Heterocapsa_arctica.AAC.1